MIRAYSSLECRPERNTKYRSDSSFYLHILVFYLIDLFFSVVLAQKVGNLFAKSLGSYTYIDTDTVRFQSYFLHALLVAASVVTICKELC